jgi:asparagine N-glycosylation enzyme membrane subunit Stt3
MTERGSLNFSFLLAGIYMISSIIALDAYPNLYLVISSFLIGIILAFIITRAFLDLHNSTKVVVATLLIYLSINILIGLIKILPHGG